MRRIAGKLCLALLALVLCFCLTACLKSVEEMYSMPKPAELDSELQKQIDIMRDHGSDFSPPLSGDTRQGYVAVNLDDDDVMEYICFFKNKSEEYRDKPLQVVIFWKAKRHNTTYEEPTTISGKGDYIDSFTCRDLDGDGNKELIIGWREGPNDKNLEIYTTRKDVIKNEQTGSVYKFAFEQIQLDNTNYTDYRLCRFSVTDKPDTLNLFVIRRIVNENGAFSASDREAAVYTLTKNEEDEYEFAADGPAQLPNVKSVEKISINKLANGIPAAYIDSESYKGGYVTDIITYQSSKLVNLTKEGKGINTIKTQKPVNIKCTDIDGDGIIDVPIFVSLHTGNMFSSEYAIQWYSYFTSYTRLKLTTYYNPDDAWYYILPSNQLDKLYVRREKSYGVQSVIFSFKSDSADSDIFRIVALRGEMIERYSEIVPNGTLLAEVANNNTVEVVYYGEAFLENDKTNASDFANNLSRDMVNKFVLKYPEWNDSVSGE